MSIKHKILSNLDYEKIINDFLNKKKKHQTVYRYKLNIKNIYKIYFPRPPHEFLT